jgi:hypothetical protein
LKEIQQQKERLKKEILDFQTTINKINEEKETKKK